MSNANSSDRNSKVPEAADKTSKHEARKERLSQALRDNLRRRKAQTRSRKAQQADQD